MQSVKKEQCLPAVGLGYWGAGGPALMCQFPFCFFMLMLSSTAFSVHGNILYLCSPKMVATNHMWFGAFEMWLMPSEELNL